MKTNRKINRPPPTPKNVDWDTVKVTPGIYALGVNENGTNPHGNVIFLSQVNGNVFAVYPDGTLFSAKEVTHVWQRYSFLPQTGVEVILSFTS